MKKFYASVVICLLFTTFAVAQDRYWVGGAPGNWNDPSRWSSTSGGQGGVGVPTSGNTAIFEEDAVVALDVNANITALRVESGATVRIYSSGANRTLTLTSTNPGSPALFIATGSRLEDSAATGTMFEVYFGPNAKASIEGTWYFTGASIDDAAIAIIEDQGQTSTAINIENGGAIIVGPNGGAPLAEDNLLNFLAGSTYEHRGDPAVIPAANYDQASTVIISGLIANGVSIEDIGDDGALGNLIISCPDLSDEATLGLPNNFTVQGNLQILNTNGNPLVLFFNPEALPAVAATIGGDLDIQGNSDVVVASAQTDDLAYELTINGDLLAGGNSFNLQAGNESGIKPTTVFIGGNLVHSAGSFGVSSAQSSLTDELFILEFIGSGTHTLSSHNASMADANHQVILRMNSTGALSLSSNFSVGKLSFNTTNGGVINTGAFWLHVTNPGTEGVVALHESSPNLGYVAGRVRRSTVYTDPVLFPTGGGGLLRIIEAVPATEDPSVYEAAYSPTGHSTTLVQSPLKGIEQNFYWDLSRISGADAAVQITVPGAVSGAQAIDALVVARFNGTRWVSELGEDGTAVTPGDTTAGVARSTVLSSFSPFTIGYGLLAALPIELVSFDAKKNAQGAEVRWKVSEGSTPVSFDVLRSADGVNFTPIGTVAAAVQQTSYSFQDLNLQPGANHYRLRMVDIDGSYSYSQIVTVRLEPVSFSFSAPMPSVVRDRTRLMVTAGSKGTLQLVVSDISGRILQTQVVAVTAGTQEVWLETTRLPNGIFQVSGIFNGTKQGTRRFIKR